MDGLANCTQLNSLNLSECAALQNVDGLRGCTLLTSLDLSDCYALESVKGLASCGQLTSLNLNMGRGWQASTVLQSLDGLEGCEGLTTSLAQAIGKMELGERFGFVAFDSGGGFARKVADQMVFMDAQPKPRPSFLRRQLSGALAKSSKLGALHTLDGALQEESIGRKASSEWLRRKSGTPEPFGSAGDKPGDPAETEGGKGRRTRFAERVSESGGARIESRLEMRPAYHECTQVQPNSRSLQAARSRSGAASGARRRAMGRRRLPCVA